MKVDEFVTIYKLLTEQNYYTLPFCILAVYGLIELLFGFVRKRLTKGQNVVHGLAYTICFIIALSVLIYKRDYDEALRKDALVVKQYIDEYAGDYEVLKLKTVTDYFSGFEGGRINEIKMLEIVKRFPNDFSVIPMNDCGLYLKIEDTLIMNKHKRQIENLAYNKLLGLLPAGGRLKIQSLFDSVDQRLTNKLLEKVVPKHTDQFIITGSNKNFYGYVLRIR